MPAACSRSRSVQPVPRHPAGNATHLALEKVIQDHIPTVTNILRCLLSLLTSSDQPPSNTRRSLQSFESDLRRLCVQAQEGVQKMDLELRVIENTWDCVDKQRWEICRGDYNIVMTLVQEVFEAGRMRMEEIGVIAAGIGIRGRTMAGWGSR